jgi:hypothetical protein
VQLAFKAVRKISASNKVSECNIHRILAQTLMAEWQTLSAALNGISDECKNKIKQQVTFIRM